MRGNEMCAKNTLPSLIMLLVLLLLSLLLTYLRESQLFRFVSFQIVVPIVSRRRCRAHLLARKPHQSVCLFVARSLARSVVELNWQIIRRPSDLCMCLTISSAPALL